VSRTKPGYLCRGKRRKGEGEKVRKTKKDCQRPENIRTRWMGEDGENFIKGGNFREATNLQELIGEKKRKRG